MTKPRSSKDAKPTKRLAVRKDSLAYWCRQPIWTLDEFARLCCGWVPSDKSVPHLDAYNYAVSRINRAVRVGRLDVDPHDYPPEGTARLLMSELMFRRADVTSWATEKFPVTFCLSATEPSRDADSAVGSTPEDALDSWKREDAWTWDEFAKLCCGWVPSGEQPDHEAWKDALEQIRRAFEGGQLLVSDLRWPAVDHEKTYAEVPLFRPGNVVRWAKEMFPDEFPFDPSGWSVPLSNGPESSDQPATPNDRSADAAGPTGRPAAANVFRCTPEGWEIRYGGQTWSGKSRLGGLSLIQTLLGSPGTLFSSEVLLGCQLVEYRDDPHGQPDEQPVSSPAADSAGTLIRDATARRKARERRDQIKKDLDLERVPRQDISNLKEEYLALCRYVRTSPAGQLRKDNPDQERARKAAQNRYSRALKLLRKNHLDRLVEHLRKSIRGGESYTYQQTSDVDWLT